MQGESRGVDQRNVVVDVRPDIGTMAATMPSFTSARRTRSEAMVRMLSPGGVFVSVSPN
jgi:hypothetical protein